MTARGLPDCPECRGEGLAHHIERPNIFLPPNDGPIAYQKSSLVDCPACAARLAKIAAFERAAMSQSLGDDVRYFASWLNETMPEYARIRLSPSVWERLSKPYQSEVAAFLGATAYDTLMGNLIGSSWGGWIVQHDALSGSLEIERRPCGNERTYTSPDRR